MTPNQIGLDKKTSGKTIDKKSMAVDLVCFAVHLGHLAVVSLAVVLF